MEQLPLRLVVVIMVTTSITCSLILPPAIASSGAGAEVDAVIRENAKLTVKELSNRSAIIGEAVDSGKVQIVPAYYHLDSGQVEFLG